MKNQSIWDQVISFLEKEISMEDINKWIKPLQIVAVTSDLVTISAPNKFVKSWVEDKYTDNIKNILNNNLSINADVKIILGNSIKKEQNITHYTQVINNIPTAKETQDMYSMPLNKDYTFDNFVEGASNKFAYVASMAISKGFNSNQNPLYIYGDVGLGKTHLMHAIGNQIRKNFPKFNVLCTTGELYMNEFIQSMKNKKTEEFKEKYASIDVLLFDDVQTIVRGEKTTEEFFFLFSLMHNNNRQIVLTSNTAPDEIKDLDKRLMSRFSSGLMVEVTNPSIEEKIAIILKHSQLLNTKISNDVVEFIAENIKSTSTRDLIGLLRSLVTKAELMNADITLDYIKTDFKTFFINRDKTLTPEEIIDTVSKHYNLKPIDLKSKKRTNNILIPRCIAMYLLQEKTHLSLSSIGEYFDKDHSTVINSIKKINKYINDDKDEIIINTIEDLNKKMKKIIS